ncbi:Rad52/Rad22 family DNA repair protein [Larkinella humicola]|uniref:DNA repair protein Rad52 n=1 Tax=Larkinella humicola TaxID=2607654 RepID=A0A5N1JP36_9BACT|nr:Rad52/Rad22 family DNA repair protein [Larkinella humicola]KAA9357227.1 DNA repair protein Rad52 [Larkinella humicola]
MEISKLTAPLRPDEIEWRVQQQIEAKNGKPAKLIVVPYITNRCVMERFDDQFGWTNWGNEIKEVDGGFLCTITVTLPTGEKVSKTDGASRTNVEPLKGGISDAMKRAAVQFGLGRALYSFPRVFVEVDGKYIPEWATRLLDALVDSINSGKPQRDVIVLKEEHIQKLQPPKTLRVAA